MLLTRISGLLLSAIAVQLVADSVQGLRPRGLTSAGGDSARPEGHTARVTRRAPLSRLLPAVLLAAVAVLALPGTALGHHGRRRGRRAADHARLRRPAGDRAHRRGPRPRRHRRRRRARLRRGAAQRGGDRERRPGRGRPRRSAVASARPPCCTSSRGTRWPAARTVPASARGEASSIARAHQRDGDPTSALVGIVEDTRDAVADGAPAGATDSTGTTDSGARRWRGPRRCSPCSASGAAACCTRAAAGASATRRSRWRARAPTSSRSTTASAPTSRPCTPAATTVAQQALADAAERYNATGALLSQADTPGEFEAARRTVVEGLAAARLARTRLGLDPGPEIPPPPGQGPQLQAPQRVQVGDDEYEGSPEYAPGRQHYFGGGMLGGRMVPGGWYGVPFWETMLIGSMIGGGFGGFGGGFGGGYGGYHAGYEEGVEDATGGYGGRRLRRRRLGRRRRLQRRRLGRRRRRRLGRRRRRRRRGGGGSWVTRGPPVTTAPGAMTSPCASAAPGLGQRQGGHLRGVGHPRDEPAVRGVRRGEPGAGLPRLRLPAGAQGGGEGGHRRRRQPVRHHLGREGLPRRHRRQGGRDVPRLDRRPGDRALRHLRLHRGDDRDPARDGRPGRRGHRLRALLRELRPRRGAVGRDAALRAAARSPTGPSTRPSSARPSPSGPGRSSSTPRTTPRARSSPAPSST